MAELKKDKISFQKATVKDADKFLELEKSVIGPKTYSGIRDRKEAEEEFENNIIYFIKQGEEIIGSCQYEIKDKNTAYLSGLVIKPEFQNKGVGRKALKFQLKKTSDKKFIKTATHPHNIKMLKLLFDNGFLIESIDDNYYGDDQPGQLRLILQKINESYEKNIGD